MAGAVIGGAVGGPQGASIGWAVGTLVGTALFPPRQEPQSRGRLDDMKVTGSGYGAPIPQVYGSMRVGGNIVWASERRKHTTKKKRGAKSIAKPTQKKVTEYVDLMVSLCKGPVGEIRKVWAEDHVIYDITTFPHITPSYIVTDLLGAEDQMPWSVAEALEGSGNVPAYRGQCLLGFDNWDLSPYGNRVPAVTALIGPVSDNPTALFWLDANTIGGLNDGDIVTSWSDRSGNTFHAANISGTNEPIYKRNIKAGRPIVRAATGNWLDIPSMTVQAANNWSFYVVCNPTNIIANDGWIFRSDGEQVTFYNSDDTIGGIRKVGYYDGAFKPQALPTTGWQILSYHLNQEESTGEVYRNETLLGTGTYPIKRTIETPGIFNVGGGGAGTSFIGDAGEIIMFEGVHSATQRQEVLDYLNGKWSVY